MLAYLLSAIYLLAFLLCPSAYVCLAFYFWDIFIKNRIFIFLFRVLRAPGWAYSGK